VGTGRASAPKHPPNTRLTWQRLQRGWSREELVEQIKQSMRRAAEAESGLNADVVRRWETGDRKPEPRYKKHLVLVFGKPASELGLLSAEELALCPAESPPATTNALANEQHRSRAPDGDGWVVDGTPSRSCVVVYLFLTKHVR
jgi:transcriptional regulator with XRE-family HTH domain